MYSFRGADCVTDQYEVVEIVGNIDNNLTRSTEVWMWKDLISGS